ncbi:uroporphyrinogen-III synthase [Saccharopolyspora mangrovi]|uniref:Uroporphyrinogen-III synthase n=1 Tax=Saccharopolyspora mangrovi TaxID=3082379 RepID=A0ABU6A349_9PSEU|nr:uroporphyrinogen-III synthase [Saccharopolyspora sp. S2-29]MEB3365967.1 uroporphyrinogen-III synthase [Saccharopolyspora sp. S2-29]
MQDVLSGFTIGITAERKAEEIGNLLARRGARVLFGAAMHTVPLPEDGELAAATERVLSAPVDFVVAITGMGFKGWFEAAGDALVEHLRGARVVARGAKAKGAVRGVGLREEWTSPTEESAEVLAHLMEQGVAGKRVVLQLHGDPMLGFRRELTEAGAEVVPVAVYRWTDPVDLDALDRLIDAVIAGEVDALPFTSAPAATNFLARAERTDRGEALREALRDKVLIACVGPVTAAPIAKAGLPHEIPDRARTAALVKLVEQELPARDARA